MFNVSQCDMLCSRFFKLLLVIKTLGKVSLAALGQLNKMMKDNEKVTIPYLLPSAFNFWCFQVELLGPAIDHLFSMCCMQYRYVLQTKMKVDNANGKEVSF